MRRFSRFALSVLVCLPLVIVGACVGDDPSLSYADAGTEATTGEAGGADAAPSDAPAAADVVDAADAGDAGKAATLLGEVTGDVPSTIIANSSTVFWLAGGTIHKCAASCAAVPGTSGATAIAVTDTTLTWITADGAITECTLPACTSPAMVGAPGTLSTPAARISTVFSGVPLLFALAGEVQRCAGSPVTTCGAFIGTHPPSTVASARGGRLIAATNNSVVFCTATNPGCSGTLTSNLAGITAVHVADLDHGFIAASTKVYHQNDNNTDLTSPNDLVDFASLLKPNDRIVDLAADIATARVYALVQAASGGAQLLTARLALTQEPSAILGAGTAGTTKGSAKALLLSQGALYFVVVDSNGGSPKSQLFRTTP